MAFFPNYLKWRYCMKQIAKRTPLPQDHNTTIQEVLNDLRKEGPIWEPHLFLSQYDLILNDEIENDAIHKIATSPELRKVLYWISKRMLGSFGIDNYMTTDVFTRIGTSMLNKLVYDGIISKELNMYYHDNFIRNLRDLFSCDSEESLPF